MSSDFLGTLNLAARVTRAANCRALILKNPEIEDSYKIVRLYSRGPISEYWETEGKDSENLIVAVIIRPD